VFNTLLATGRGVDAHYDKIHLYDAFGYTESRTVAPGHDPVVISVDGVDVGLTTCYDIRFPALYTELAARGAQLIVVAASFAAGPGKLDQWTLLARARALDSGSFVAAVDQPYPGDALAHLPCGVGGSVVASPLGEVIAAAGNERGLLVADIVPNDVVAAREALAVLENRAQFGHIGKRESVGEAESRG
jgi:deaminated glutathione amidase